jgi:hypothetical protein
MVAYEFVGLSCCISHFARNLAQNRFSDNQGVLTGRALVQGLPPKRIVSWESPVLQEIIVKL